MKRFLYLFLTVFGLCFVLALSAGAAYTTTVEATVNGGDKKLGVSYVRGTYTLDSFSFTYTWDGESTELYDSGTRLVLNGVASVSSYIGYFDVLSGSMANYSIEVWGVPATHPDGSYVLLGTVPIDDYVNTGSSSSFNCNIYSKITLSQAVKKNGIKVIFNFSPDVSLEVTSKGVIFDTSSSTTLAVSSQTASTSDLMIESAQQIIDSLGSDIQLGNDELINIRQYVHSLYEFFTRPFTDSDGVTYVYDWNMYVVSTIQFLSALQSQNLTTHNKLTDITNKLADLYLAMGFNPLYGNGDGWDTLKEAMKTMNVSIIAAIENGVMDILNGLDDAYANVDTSGLDSGSADTNTMISESDEIESGLMQSATDAMGDINLDTPGIGSQTLSAMVALLPFYDGFFTASGEVGLVLVFSLAVGIVLLLIGRSGIAFISRVEHASRNKDGDDL